VTLPSDTPSADTRSGAVDELLSHFAAGRLAPALHALVASHLVLTPRSRGFVGALEEAASAQIEGDEIAEVSDRDACLAAIFAAEPLVAAEAPAEPAAIPAPLAQIFGDAAALDVKSLSWKRYLPGIKRVAASAHPQGGAANLYWIRAGQRLPRHTHEGQEITLVLRGGFSDVTGHYARGDIAVADADLDHKPVADSGEDCICFAVTDAPLQLTGPIGRVVQRMFGART
jgi:putative transcriptional regulator